MFLSYCVLEITHFFVFSSHCVLQIRHLFVFFVHCVLEKCHFLGFFSIAFYATEFFPLRFTQLAFQKKIENIAIVYSF
ncbi:hypothetical protein HanRHA438_Chr17g0830791 [Helianthus annuus]|nr:hypothetical protein HanRHA438_Chr17g0830791 [Helianthus annuus]